VARSFLEAFAQDPGSARELIESASIAR